MANQHQPLLSIVVQLAHDLPPELVHQLAVVLEANPHLKASAALALVEQTFTQTETQWRLRRLCEAWQATPEVTPAAIAWALRGATQTEQFHRQRQQLELVWTGPTVAGSSLRRTDQALLHLIQRAHRTLWLVTFAAYHVPTVSAALKAAAARGVAVHFVAESSEESDMTWGAVEAVGGRLPSQTQIYVWPREQRPVSESGHRGSLHAKCAVADEAIAFVSSANLTEHALNLNMEMGLLVTGGEIPPAIVSHLQSLIESKVLKPVVG